MIRQNNTILKTFLLYKYQMIILLIISIFSLMITVTKSILLGTYVDMLIKSISVNDLYYFVIILFVLEGSSIIFSFVIGYYTLKIQTKMTFDINFNLLEHIKRLPINFFKNKDAFYINQRVNSDINVVTSSLLTFCVNAVTVIVTFISIIIILNRYDSVIALIAGLSIPVFLLLYYCFNKCLLLRIKEFKEVQNQLFAFIGKQLNNITYIKINSLYERLGEKLMKVFPSFFSSVLKYLKASLLFAGTSNILESLFSIFLYMYVGLQIIKKNMTVGEFITIQSFYMTFLGNIGEFTGILKKYPEVKVSYNRLIEILETNIEKNGNIILTDIAEIKVNNISFFYENQKVIEGFSCKMKRGYVYLINGKNGAGKSTLIKSILGLYNENITGDIKINNRNIDEIDMYNTRQKLIAVVDQDAEFYFDSIAENLNSDIQQADIIQEYMKRFQLTIKESLFNANVQNQLSGGEKQKISIIRSFLQNPRVLILDEPSSALDEKSVNYLISQIEDGRHERITIIISHDDRLKNIADYIINL